MKCSPIKLDSGHWYCERCQYTSKRILEKAFVKECTPGLGDKIEKSLSWIGITKQKVNEVVNYISGKNESSCGCGERQDYLNELGKKIGL